MEQLHHSKGKTGLAFPVAALDPEEIMRHWQSRASKVLHAQERIAQSMAAALQAQLRYGQEFMASHLNILQWEMTDAAQLSEQTRRDIENFAALIKEVSGEFRSAFAEAGELLEVKPYKPQAPAAPVAKEVAEPAAPSAEPPPVAAKVTEPVAEPPVAPVKAAPAAAKTAAPARVKRPVSRTRRKA